MRQIDFNEEKREEKIQRAMSGDQVHSPVDYLLMTFSGEQPKTQFETEVRQRRAKHAHSEAQPYPENDDDDNDCRSLV